MVWCLSNRKATPASDPRLPHSPLSTLHTSGAHTPPQASCSAANALLDLKCPFHLECRQPSGYTTTTFHAVKSRHTAV